MKVKLLKKIRKRFTIDLIEEVSYSSTSILYEIWIALDKQPFYRVTDNETWMGTNYYKTKEEAIERVRILIRREYAEKIKGFKVVKKNIKF